MNTKLLEIRDEGTCILAIGIQMQAPPDPPVPRWEDTVAYWFLHYRSGYPEDGSSIMLMCLEDGRATNDPYEWGSRGMGLRTMPNAHNYIIEHWDELKDGDVVDVQVILGETTEPKKSERLRLPVRLPDQDAALEHPNTREVFTMAEYRRDNSE